MSDKCPHCGGPRPYLMARNATENVLSWRAIAWIWAAVAALVVILLASS